jgi:hypothetical protein
VRRSNHSGLHFLVLAFIPLNDNIHVLMQSHVHYRRLFLLFIQFQRVEADFYHVSSVRLLEFESEHVGAHELLVVFYEVLPTF